MRKFFRISKLSVFVTSIGALLLILNSCKKDKNVLEANVQDEEDVLNVQFSDTATVYAHTIRYDSIASYNDNIKFLGSNQDPVFGRMDVGLYTKFCLPNNITNVSFGEDANLISAEIILVVKSLDFVGDYLCPLTYQVFEMNANLPNNKVYYSNHGEYYNPTNILGSFTGTFAVMNGALVVKIPVNSTYGAAILNNPQYMLDNNTFQNTYKGIYISTKTTNLNPNSAQGVISRLDLNADLSGLYLYYQNGTPSSSKETKSFKFPFNGADVLRFNHVKYNFLDGGNNLLASQLQGDTTAGKQDLFLKGLGATKVKIHIPFLTNYVAKHKISVNRADIVFKVDQGINGDNYKYATPPRMALLAMDSLSREIFTYDQLSSIDFARYGGTYDPDNKQYVFNIARDIQTIMNGKRKNLGFYLVVANPDKLYTARRDDMAERVVLGGTASALYKPVFHLSYIPFTND